MSPMGFLLSSLAAIFVFGIIGIRNEMYFRYREFFREYHPEVYVRFVGYYEMVFRFWEWSFDPEKWMRDEKK